MRSYLLSICLLLSSIILHAQWDTVLYSQEWTPHYKIGFVDDSNGLVTGESWNFYTTHDIGETWEAIPFLPGFYYDFQFISDSNAIVMSSNGFFFLLNIHTEAISEWYLTPDTYDLYDMELLNDSTILAAGWNGMYIFNLNAEDDTVWLCQSIGMYSGMVNSISRLNNTILFANAEEYNGNWSKLLLKSVDNGYTWSVINPNLGFWGYRLYVLTETNLFIVGDYIYKSSDGGFNWTVTTCDPDTTAGFLDITFTDLNTGYAVGGSNIIPEPPHPTNIYKTLDGGNTWYLQYYSDHSRLFSVFFLNDSIGFACGDHLAIVKTTNGGGIGTNIIQHSINELTGLAYPNPFTSSTTIEYKLFEKSNIQFTIYNSVGEIVYRTANHNILPGKHSITPSLQHLPAGMYYVVVKTDEGNSIVKMIKQ